MAALFLTCLTCGWEPLGNSCCNQECDQPIHAIDVEHLISPEARQRLALALAHLHGLQQLHVAAVPRGEPVGARQLRMDDCQVVYECAMYQPRS
jgi:hypothetical protein